MTALSALALLVAAGSSVAADSNSQSQSYLLTTHARSLGMRAIKKARSKVLAGRRMKEAGDDTDLGDMSDLGMGGFDMSAFGSEGSGDVTGEQLNQLVPMMCLLFSSGMIQDGLEDNLDTDMETEGVVCSDFGCDNAATPNLVMNCTMDREYCDGEGDEEFCVTDNEIKVSMGLDFVDPSQLTATQCSTYTKPAYMAEMGHGCWTVDASIDFGAMMEMEASDFAEMGTMTEEEAGKMSTEFIQITECSADFGDGTKCECGICDEGMGFELTCNNNGTNLVSEECTDFDTSVADVGAISGGGTTSPEISVMKLSATPDAGNVVKETDADTGTAMMTDETSPAASRAGAMAAGLVLAFASFLALM